MWDVVYVKLLEAQKKHDISHYLRRERKKMKKTKLRKIQKKKVSLF